MALDVQFRIKQNPYYLRYLRENSYWYKLLNRNPQLFRAFEEEVKQKYKLTKADRISKMFNTFEILEKVLSTFN